MIIVNDKCENNNQCPDQYNSSIIQKQLYKQYTHPNRTLKFSYDPNTQQYKIIKTKRYNHFKEPNTSNNKRKYRVEVEEAGVEEVEVDNIDKENFKRFIEDLDTNHSELFEKKGAYGEFSRKSLVGKLLINSEGEFAAKNPSQTKYNDFNRKAEKAFKKFKRDVIKAYRAYNESTDPTKRTSNFNKKISNALRTYAIKLDFNNERSEHARTFDSTDTTQIFEDMPSEAEYTKRKDLLGLLGKEIVTTVQATREVRRGAKKYDGGPLFDFIYSKDPLDRIGATTKESRSIKVEAERIKKERLKQRFIDYVYNRYDQSIRLPKQNDKLQQIFKDFFQNSPPDINPGDNWNNFKKYVKNFK